MLATLHTDSLAISGNVQCYDENVQIMFCTLGFFLYKLLSIKLYIIIDRLHIIF